jgi:hypothetical protein
VLIIYDVRYIDAGYYRKQRIYYMSMKKRRLNRHRVYSPVLPVDTFTPLSYVLRISKEACDFCPISLKYLHPCRVLRAKSESCNDLINSIFIRVC